MTRPLTFLLADSEGVQHTVKIDWADAPLVMTRTWHIHRSRSHLYVRANGSSGIMLHRFILGVDDPDTQVDHRDGNTLDNRRLNLRPVTKSENTHNTRRSSTGQSSKFRGVSWSQRLGKWEAMITVEKKRTRLGAYMREAEAARAYNAAARELVGACAQLNAVRAARAPRSSPAAGQEALQ